MTANCTSMHGPIDRCATLELHIYLLQITGAIMHDLYSIYHLHLTTDGPNLPTNDMIPCFYYVLIMIWKLALIIYWCQCNKYNNNNTAGAHLIRLLDRILCPTEKAGSKWSQRSGAADHVHTYILSWTIGSADRDACACIKQYDLVN
jgi:hypothetical protein